MCGKHWKRWAKFGDPTARHIFQNETPCIECGAPASARQRCARCYVSWRRVNSTGSFCTVDGCTAPMFGRGMCGKHWDRWRKHGDPHQVAFIMGDDVARFWSKVDRRGPTECWPWSAPSANGYGQMSIGADGMVAAHRYAYELIVGPIPEGMTIDHMCHNEDVTCPGGDVCLHRRCVNPDHFETVPSAVNTSRAHEQHRRHLEWLALHTSAT